MDNKQIELLEKTIFPQLEKGRTEFDLPHTKAVVYYCKELIRRNPQLSLDEDVLLISAYAHDWGYANLFKQGKIIDLDAIIKVKELHAELGAKNITKLLKASEFNNLTKSQKNRIQHLVLVHDKLAMLKDDDELILMEADTLGGLDVNMTKATFDQVSNQKYMRLVMSKRRPLFISEYGKKKFTELFSLRTKYYEHI